MTRDQLIRSLLDKQKHFTYSNMGVAVKHIIQTMFASIAAGERIEIRGFGCFAPRYRNERRARNPRTGEWLEMQPKWAVHFKPGKEMKDSVNKIYQSRS